MSLDEQEVKPPKAGPGKTVEQLGYIESFDAVIDKMYAYVAYTETAADGKWKLVIKGSVTVATAIDPGNAALKKALQKAAGHDEKFAVWGYEMKTKEGDARMVQNRVLIDDKGKPTGVEVHLITRKADGTPREAEVMSIPWPAPTPE